MDESSSTSNGNGNNGTEASGQTLEQGSNGTGTGLAGTGTGGVSLFGGSSLQKKSLFGMSAPAPLVSKILRKIKVRESKINNKKITCIPSFQGR